MNSSTLTSYDVLILQAMHLSKYASVTSGIVKLIGTVDWLDHSIPSFGEINNAIDRLRRNQLLEQGGESLKFTQLACALFEEFGALYPGRQRQAICSRLDVKASRAGDRDLVATTDGFIKEDKYIEAVKTYTRGFS
jgi:hypothetical protein